MIFDLSSFVDSWGTAYTVTRPGDVSFTAGRATAGSSTTFSALLMVQPLRGRELERARDLYALKDGVRAWSSTAMSEGSALKTGDQFTYQGNVYTVVGTDDWSDHGGYYQLVAELTP